MDEVFLRFFSATKGLTYLNVKKRLVASFRGLGVIFFLTGLGVYHISGVLPALSIFTWIIGFTYFYLRVRNGLSKHLTAETLSSGASELSIPCGFDGIGRFLIVKGIPIEYFGILLGVFAGLIVMDYGVHSVIAPIFMFCSGMYGGLTLYYHQVEKKYNVKIKAVMYDKKT